MCFQTYTQLVYTRYKSSHIQLTVGCICATSLRIIQIYFFIYNYQNTLKNKLHLHFTQALPTKIVGLPTKLVGRPAKFIGQATKFVGRPTKMVAIPTKIIGSPTKKVGVPTKIIGKASFSIGLPPKSTKIKNALMVTSGHFALN
jgi:hypothetical protein